MTSNKLFDEAFEALLEIDATVDVPFVPMDKPITTNIEAPPTRQDGPIRVVVKQKDDDEEDEDEDELSEAPPAPGPPYPGGKPGGMAENLFFEQAPQPPNIPPADPGMAAVGGEPIAGMEPTIPGTESDVMDLANQPTQLSDPGKGLELKKIFSRLLALQNFLASSADQGLSVLRDYVLKAIELFRTVIDNLSSYKEKIDDIIVLFYDFIERAYAVLRDYYKNKDEKTVKISVPA
jgi:hypothetical protein